MKIKTEKRPPAVVRQLVRPWFQFDDGDGDVRLVRVGTDAQGNAILAPLRPEARALFEGKPRE